MCNFPNVKGAVCIFNSIILIASLIPTSRQVSDQNDTPCLCAQADSSRFTLVIYYCNFTNFITSCSHLCPRCDLTDFSQISLINYCQVLVTVLIKVVFFFFIYYDFLIANSTFNSIFDLFNGYTKYSSNTTDLWEFFFLFFFSAI